VDAEASDTFDERVQDVDRGSGVGERSMVRLDGGVEMARQGGEPVVRHLVAQHDASRETHGVHDRRHRPRIAELGTGPLEEADVETGVVGDDHAAVSELEELRQHVCESRRARDHRVGDAGEHRDGRRDVCVGVDERGQLTGDLAATYPHGAELRDPAVLGAARGLEIDHAERHLGQVGPGLHQEGLARHGGDATSEV